MLQDFALAFETYPIAFYVVVTLLGLIVGSFLNVVIYRLPIMMERGWKEEYNNYFNTDEAKAETERFDLVFPNSTCPSCQHKIRAWENIPVISWIVLGGKCSSCSSKISIRYPVVESITGLLSLFIGLRYGFTIETLLLLFFVWSLVALTFIDLDTMLLPDQITLPLLWLGLLVNTQEYFSSLNDAVLGAAMGYFILWGIYWSFKLLTGKEGMGYGDFKLLAALGAWLGISQLPVIIILSSFVGAIFGIAQIMMSKDKESKPIPFGPYLAIAGLIALFYGNWLNDTYWQWVLG